MNKVSKISEKVLELSSLGEERLSLIEKSIIDTVLIEGEIWECGVYKGGTSLYILDVLTKNSIFAKVKLFDTFNGLPTFSEYDIHSIGAMKSDKAEVVGLFKEFDNVDIIEGIMPESFLGLEDSRLKIVHVDVDQYESVKSILEWVYPRTVKGGYIIIDDYNCGSCPGAKKAVDEFLIDKSENIINGFGPQVYLIKE